ncbi:ArsR/SmtB family transcription factor [Salinispora arenicola]|uniref:ArsR/SmtB family transcription factor n=1 Tax=Salinispora arenicola TaxID=168697 RepID=UPI0003604001|nr:helix-turn-helix domain-containing protein [Salinispora arenicola]
MLAETLIPSTTGSLAQRVGLAPATVSQHLAVLRDAGLVTARRRGREVLYSQTPLAAALLTQRSGSKINQGPDDPVVRPATAAKGTLHSCRQGCDDHDPSART